MPGFNLNSVKYDPIGPINNFEYGVRVTFQFGDVAFNRYSNDDLEAAFPTLTFNNGN